MQFLTYLCLVLTMLFWGGTFIAGRILAEELTPTNSAFIRFAIATIALFFLTMLTNDKLRIPPRKNWLPLLLLGATGVFSYNILFFNGLQFISAGRASLIIALNPLVISVLAFLFFKEPLNFKQFIGILISLLGAILVISNGHPEEILNSNIGKGEIALLGCVFSWAAYSLIGRSVLSTLSPLTSVFFSSLIGTILLFIPAIQQNLFREIETLTSLSWFCLFYLGFFGTALGFTLYYNAIKKIGPTRASIFINLVPLFSILLSWFLLGELINMIVVIGGAILLSGVALTNYCKTELISQKRKL